MAFAIQDSYYKPAKPVQPSPLQGLTGPAQMGLYPKSGQTFKPQSQVSAPAPTIAAAPQAPKPQNAAAPQTAQPAAFDYSADPILAQTRLLGQAAIPDAIAAADAQKKQLLGAFGDPALARQTVFGGKGFSLPGIAGGPAFSVADTTHIGDEQTAAAAQQNPFSVLARLLNAHLSNDTTIDNTRNSQNLFYSDARAHDLQNESHQHEQNQTDAYSQLAQALQQIDQGVQGAYQAEGARQMQAEQDAYLRALASAASGTGSTGGGDTGGGGQADGYGYADPRQEDVSRRTGATVNVPAAQLAKALAKPKAKPPVNAYARKTVANLH